MNKLTETEKAYIAGIIDGEGNISLIKRKDIIRSIDYKIEIGLSNTSIDLMIYMEERLGGSVCNKKRYSVRHKKCYQWKISRNKAYNLLKSIHPFLVIKKEQAKLAMELHNRKGKHNTKKLTNIELEYREKMYWQMKKLNKRGK